MNYRLVEIHLPGHNADKVNTLPHEYHGVLKMLWEVGINPLTTIVVAYYTDKRDELREISEARGEYSISYTGTYGELPEENLDEFLIGSTRQWDLIIAGRFWGACHYAAYAHLIREIKKRKPNHVNFHFIKPLIDGINVRGRTDEKEGFGSYTTDSFHAAGLVKIFSDGEVKHIKAKNTQWVYDEGTKEHLEVAGLPATLTTIDLHFWSSLMKMVDFVQNKKIL